MSDLFNNPDGAGYQARAVLAYLQAYSECDYRWLPQVYRWHNCREQGYVITLRSKNRQLNIAFFEHRNSDQICSIKWEQMTVSGNPPTISDADFSGTNYQNDKYDVSHTVGYGLAKEMAEWIHTQMAEFWSIDHCWLWPSQGDGRMDTYVDGRILDD